MSFTVQKNVKIGIIGGDTRQAVLARRLSKLGFETAVWGLNSNADIGDAVRSSDWYGAVNNSRIVILPVPSSRDGVRVSGCELFVADMFSAMQAESVVFCAIADSNIKTIAKEHNIVLRDYFDNEVFQINNAIPTAEGAVEIAMHEMSITLHGAHALVCGYGRIGKALASILKGLGTHVTVSARRSEDIAYITASGYDAVRYDGAELGKKMCSFDVVFNTVPAKLIDKSLINRIDKRCLLIDLASGAGGVDFNAAESCGIKAIHALSLPGKVAPETAGNIICDTILDMLFGEGGIAKT